MASSQDLQSVVRALSDCYDQAVFLENAAALVASAHRPGDLVELLEEARLTMRVQGAALNFKNRWLSPAPDWLRAQAKPSRRRVVKEGTTSVLLLPLGLGWLAFWEEYVDFSANDLRLAETVGHMINTTLEALEAREVRAQAQMEEHERRLAVQIWRTVISETLPAVPHYSLHALSRPARQVGGDFHAVAGDWLIVGDVSGKGIPAALFSAMFVASFRLAAQHTDPGAALETALFHELERSTMFATVIAVQLTPEGRLRYFNLGHPPALVIREEGGIERLPATAPPIGTFPLSHYALRETQLMPGDMLCLYSDGVNEAKREDGETELYELERLEASLFGAANPADAVRRVMDGLEGWEVDDDLTLVVSQYQPSPQNRCKP